MAKKVLIVGFGLMGCRHAQSLLNSPDNYEVIVYEPSVQNVEENLSRIGAAKDSFTWIDSLETADSSIDVAIVATSSKPRFEIVNVLLGRGVRLFLLEKIVFQSAEQFEIIINLLQQHRARAYCNFVNRYFNAYDHIRSSVGSQVVNMNVYGGKFGLACNAIHYIDIFQYLTSDNSVVSTHSSLKELGGENRRGKDYKEFSGTLSLSAGAGKLQIISDADFSGGLIISVSVGNKRFLLNEVTGKMFEYNGMHCVESPFIIEPTSKLTGRIISEMVAGTCRLTVLQDTFAGHKALFKEINSFVYNTSGTNVCCPIT